MSRLPRDLEDLLSQLDGIEGSSFDANDEVEHEVLAHELRSMGTSGGIGLALRQAYGDGGIHEAD